MSAHEKAQLDPQEPVRLGSQAPKLISRCLALFVVGLVAGVAGSFLFTPAGQGPFTYFMMSYLIAFAFVLSLAMGSLFFVFINHLTRAGWSVALRRLVETFAVNLALVAVMFLPILGTVLSGATVQTDQGIGGVLYPWAIYQEERDAALATGHSEEASPEKADESEDADPSHGSQDESSASSTDHAEAKIYTVANEPDNHGDAKESHETEEHEGAHHGSADPQVNAEIHRYYDDFTHKKVAYLNIPFFAARWIFLLALWAFFGWWFWSNSVKQDANGDPSLTQRMERPSGIIALVFGLTITFGSWDLLMTLNPHWYSTIFGIYYFAGAVVGSLSLIILSLLTLQKLGFLRSVITVEHYHDLGKLLFGFTFFWGYIAFSQYMLIWYANMPETTGWFVLRGASQTHPNGWSVVALTLLFGHFIIPFIMLLSRVGKRNVKVLGFWAGWMLVMHFVDMWWLVMPELGPALTIPVAEIGLTVALTSLFIAGAVYVGAKHDIIPTRDPRLGESLNFHNF